MYHRAPLDHTKVNRAHMGDRVQGSSEDRRSRLAEREVSDVFVAGGAKERASVIRSEANKPSRLEITEETRKSFDRWM